MYAGKIRQTKYASWELRIHEDLDSRSWTPVVNITSTQYSLSTHVVWSFMSTHGDLH